MTCQTIAPQIQPIKRGDSFLMACVYKVGGAPADVTNYAIRSQVRDSSDNLVQELTVTKADQTTDKGVFVLSAGVIAAWPIDLLRCDIEFSEEATVRSTQTFMIPVVEDVTRD
jgi:hypothetical protein